MSAFDDLLAEGAAVDVSTWGAGFLNGRYHEEPTPWSYQDIVRTYTRHATTMLDMGTGDGSGLLDLTPLPAHTVAYEEWAPTLPAAVDTLLPAGVAVVHCLGSEDNVGPPAPGRPTLPFLDGCFDLVVNRHEGFSSTDVRRILRPGGVFVTQQVGSSHGDEIRRLLGLPPEPYRPWTQGVARRQVEAGGLTVLDGAQAYPDMWFSDVGALVAYLRAVPWYVPDFTVRAYRRTLLRLHEAGETHAPFHVFWLAAKRAN